ncbi:hypothetical protein FQA39_LY16974 [Lamprigera yunnana]|nr:hypothetical protein FQA39_LY16974 [Lamprigera yunnana]
MPKKRRPKHRKVLSRNRCFDQDLQIRSLLEDHSLNISSYKNEQIENFKRNQNVTRFDADIEDGSELDYSGLKSLFSSKNGCHSSSLVEEQPKHYEITHTPRVKKQQMLEFSYSLESLSKSTFGTPIKKCNENSDACIQDLNNLYSEEKIVNCTRTFNSKSLEHLQNFNNVILSTTQDINYENSKEYCEPTLEAKQVRDNIDNLFCTPQLCNYKFASTPMHERKCAKSVGTQTQSPKKLASFTVTKQKNSKNSQSIMFCCKSSQLQYNKQRRYSPIERISVTRDSVVATLTTVEMCSQIASNIKKYHGRYSSLLPTKIYDLCIWLGDTLKRGLLSLFKLYNYPKKNSYVNCTNYMNDLVALTASFQNLKLEIMNLRSEIINQRSEQVNLRSEIINLKEDNIERWNKLHNFVSQELYKFEGNLKSNLRETKISSTQSYVIPPPPPPPPPLSAPPPMLLVPPSSGTRTEKNIEIGKPVISLDDILKVKLRKISDRPGDVRRHSHSVIPATLRKNLKPITKEETPVSSPLCSKISPLTKILTGVDTHDRAAVKT